MIPSDAKIAAPAAAEEGREEESHRADRREEEKAGKTMASRPA